MQSAVLARELDAARAVYWEDPAGSLATAIRVQESARAHGHDGLLGLAVARTLSPGRNGFALGVLHSTRADIGLLAGEPERALADAEQAIAFMTAGGDPNPYVFGVTVRAHVQALMALGRLDDARAT